MGCGRGGVGGWELWVRVGVGMMCGRSGWVDGMGVGLEVAGKGWEECNEEIFTDTIMIVYAVVVPKSHKRIFI